MQSLKAAQNAADEPPDEDDAPPQDGRPLSIGFTDLRGEDQAQLLLMSHKVSEAAFQEIPFALGERLFVSEPEGHSNLQEHSGGGAVEEGWKCGEKQDQSVPFIPSLKSDYKATECVNTFNGNLPLWVVEPP